eukprot:m.268341 g.268341  ORF g.268341 m.268341 type:complete len:266 (-) comp78064_c0_seq1:289-1086(-)
MTQAPRTSRRSLVQETSLSSRRSISSPLNNSSNYSVGPVANQSKLRSKKIPRRSIASPRGSIENGGRLGSSSVLKKPNGTPRTRSTRSKSAFEQNTPTPTSKTKSVVGNEPAKGDSVKKVPRSKARPGGRLFQLYSGCRADIIKREVVTESSTAISRSQQNNIHTHKRKQYIVYTIRIQSRFDPKRYKPWVIHRRYSDFDKLQKGLLRATENAKVLRLVSKNSFQNNMDEEFLAKRQAWLKAYLDGLLAVVSLARHPITLKFLEA